MWFMLAKLHNLGDFNWLPSVFITGESITNTKNFTNIRKTSKSFVGMPIRNRRSCSMKNTGDEKSRALFLSDIILPFSIRSLNILWCLVLFLLSNHPLLFCVLSLLQTLFCLFPPKQAGSRQMRKNSVHMYVVHAGFARSRKLIDLFFIFSFYLQYTTNNNTSTV